MCAAKLFSKTGLEGLSWHHYKKSALCPLLSHPINLHTRWCRLIGWLLNNFKTVNVKDIGSKEIKKCGVRMEWKNLFGLI